MKVRFYKSLVLIICLCTISVKAQYKFIENGGQWVDRALFRADIPGGNLYLEQDRLTFNLYDTEVVDAVFAAHRGSKKAIPPPQYLNCHAYEVEFINTSTTATIEAVKPDNTRYSFYLGEKRGSNLQAYAEVRYREIFTGIDLKLYSKQSLKYDFIVKANADPRQIRLKYHGVDPKIKNGRLIIETSVGEVNEMKPFAYQIIDRNIVAVSCDYRLIEGTLTFELGEYNQQLELIIDPELVFSTYSGSTSDNFGYTATFDQEGHLYAGSTAFGVGYPVTTGAYQASWAGGVGAGTLAGTDIAISKFTLDGTGLAYSTYLGGNGDELPHSLICDDEANLYIFGTTGSNNFPVTANCFQPNFAGGTATTLGGIGISYPNGADMIVARLNTEGTDLMASTYVGGTANDGTNTATALRYNYADEVRGEIELDIDGNIVVGSCTSSSNFPVSGAAYQATKSTGQDGVVFKMDNGMTTLIASTFFGGNQSDAVYSIHVTDNGLITAGGGTSSNNLPTTPGVYQESYAGGRADGIIAVFNQQLETLESMTYYGSSVYDQIYFIERDNNGAPHIYGQTEATGNFFIENAVFNEQNSGMLLSKFSANLSSRTWSTVFGNGVNTPNLSPTAFSVDVCNRIYLSGWGGSVGSGEQGNTTGLPVTGDAIKSTTNGNDFYFMVISADAGSLEFGSFFGGNSSNEHVDGGTSRFDRSGKIYQAVCAGCGSNDDFPIEPENAHSPTNNSTNCNLGVAKIDFDLPLVIADFGSDEICFPSPVQFINTSSFGSQGSPSYTWFFPNNVELNEENPTYTFEAPGSYEVTLVITDPLACNLSDTLSQLVTILPQVELNLIDTLSSCSESIFNITADSEGTANSFIWAENPLFENPIQSGADSVINYQTMNPGYLYLLATNGLCETVDSVFLAPPPTPQLSLEDTLLCSGSTFEVFLNDIDVSSVSSVLWSPENLVQSGQGSTSVVFDNNSSFEYSAEVETIFGCQVLLTGNAEISPIALSVPSDSVFCESIPINLSANSFGTAQDFIWSTSPDFSTTLNPQGDSIITVIPGSATTYYISVQNGNCQEIDSVRIGVLAQSINISNDRFICAGDTVKIQVSVSIPGSSITYSWQPEEYIISGAGTNSIEVVVDEPTVFTVVAASSSGCTVERSTSIFTSNLGLAEVDALADPVNITISGSSTLSAIPNNEDYIYSWTPTSDLQNPNGSSTIASPSGTTTYYVTIRALGENGLCVKSDSVTVFVFDEICGEPSIFVPNTFTPNNDGENDLLLVRGNNITDIYFIVFNRWGEMVFETREQAIGWDGNYKGQIGEPAVYVYYLEVRCGDGQNYFTKGNVTLAR